MLGLHPELARPGSVRPIERVVGTDQTDADMMAEVGGAMKSAPGRDQTVGRTMSGVYGREHEVLGKLTKQATTIRRQLLK